MGCRWPTCETMEMSSCSLLVRLLHQVKSTVLPAAAHEILASHLSQNLRHCSIRRKDSEFTQTRGEKLPTEGPTKQVLHAGSQWDSQSLVSSRVISPAPFQEKSWHGNCRTFYFCPLNGRADRILPTYGDVHYAEQNETHPRDRSSVW
jgi:hypothetical protein